MTDGTFSEAYWSMHRNTLFFSFVCLLLSAPDVSVGGEISQTLAIKIGAHAGKFIVFSSLAIAFYNLAIFWLEWRQQAWPHLQKRYDAFKDRASIDSSNFAILTASMAKAANSIDEIRCQISDRLRSWENARNADTYRGITDFKSEQTRLRAVNELNRIVENCERNERWAKNHFQQTDDGKMWLSVKTQVDAILAVVDGELNAHVNACRDAVERVAVEVSNAILNPAFHKAAQDFRSVPQEKFSHDISRRYRSFLKSFQWDAIRILFLGLGLPVLLFITSTLHFVGRFWKVIFPSLFF